MEAAIKSARQGIRLDHGGPFGACIVKRGRIIATAHNTVLRDHDSTCHAEINAIRQACRKLKSHDLTGCVLYTTAEPCPMCLGAIYWARINAVHIGVTSAVAVRAGFDDALIRKDMQRPLGRHRIPMRSGVMQAGCWEVFKEWKKLNGVLY